MDFVSLMRGGAIPPDYYLQPFTGEESVQIVLDTIVTAPTM
jgi:hypothetical protein